MSDVAAYHVLLPVQGDMWTGYSQSTYLPALVTITHNNGRLIILIRDFS